MKIKFTPTNYIKVDTTDDYDDKFAPILNQIIPSIKNSWDTSSDKKFCTIDVNSQSLKRSLFKTDNKCVGSLYNILITYVNNNQIKINEYKENGATIGYYVDLNEATKSSVTNKVTVTKNAYTPKNYQSAYDSLFGSSSVKEEIDRIKRIIKN